jgi:hypothetical protein
MRLQILVLPYLSLNRQDRSIFEQTRDDCGELANQLIRVLPIHGARPLQPRTDGQQAQSRGSAPSHFSVDFGCEQSEAGLR